MLSPALVREVVQMGGRWDRFSGRIRFSFSDPRAKILWNLRKPRVGQFPAVYPRASIPMILPKRSFPWEEDSDEDDDAETGDCLYVQFGCPVPGYSNLRLELTIIKFFVEFPCGSSHADNILFRVATRRYKFGRGRDPLRYQDFHWCPLILEAWKRLLATTDLHVT